MNTILASIAITIAATLAACLGGVGLWLVVVGSFFAVCGTFAK